MKMPINALKEHFLFFFLFSLLSRLESVASTFLIQKQLVDSSRVRVKVN